jgi:hypothetical protein
VAYVPKPPKTPGTDDVCVPRLIGLMAVDARESAAKHGVDLAAPDRPEFHLVVVEYVVRQYPLPGMWVPRDAVVTVWFDLGPGDGEGGAGVREPRRPGPPDGGGLCHELAEPGNGPGTEVGAVL